MKLSPNFTLEEMTRSELALRLGLYNVPNAEEMANLRSLCLTLLEPCRAILNVPMHINSGFRSPQVNAAVGGAASSAHMDGRAADFVPVGMPLRVAFDTLRTSGLQFDQLITECDAWLHISIPAMGKAPRCEVLSASGSPGRWVYTKVGG